MIFNNGGPLYSGTPSSVCVFGGFVNTAVTAATANTIIQATFYTPSTNASSGATLGTGKTLSPLATRVPVVLFPTPAYAPQVVSNATANVWMLDLRGYPSDIASVHAQFTPAPGANGTLSAAATYGSANIIGIDNVNNFIYGISYTNTGTVIAPNNGAGVSFAVFFKESAGA